MGRRLTPTCVLFAMLELFRSPRSREKSTRQSYRRASTFARPRSLVWLGVSARSGAANLFDRKRLLFLLVGPRRGRANSCEFASRIETRNAYRGERNEQHTRARRTRSSSLDLSSFQRYRSTIRHRRRYTYTYNFSPPSPVDPRRGATHLFEHAILSFPSRFSRHPAHLDWIIPPALD